MVLECFGMYRNVLEYIAMYMNGLDILPSKFGAPNLKNVIGM